MIQKTIQFIKEVKAETKKVVYPSWTELKGSTWVVIVTTLIASFFLGGVDIFLNYLVKLVLG